MSWAILHAISLSLAGLSLPGYIDEAWGGRGPCPRRLSPSAPVISPTLCPGLQRLDKAKRQERRAVLWVFGRMEQSKGKELDEMFRNMCRLLLSGAKQQLNLFVEPQLNRRRPRPHLTPPPLCQLSPQSQGFGILTVIMYK